MAGVLQECYHDVTITCYCNIINYKMTFQLTEQGGFRNNSWYTIRHMTDHIINYIRRKHNIIHHSIKDSIIDIRLFLQHLSSRQLPSRDGVTKCQVFNYTDTWKILYGNIFLITRFIFLSLFGTLLLFLRLEKKKKRNCWNRANWCYLYRVDEKRSYYEGHFH